MRQIRDWWFSKPKVLGKKKSRNEMEKPWEGERPGRPLSYSSDAMVRTEKEIKHMHRTWSKHSSENPGWVKPKDRQELFRML